jgi:hypothetical protein
MERIKWFFRREPELEWSEEIDLFIGDVISKLDKRQKNFSEMDFWVMSALSTTNFFNIGRVIENEPIEDMFFFLGKALDYFSLTVSSSVGNSSHELPTDKFSGLYKPTGRTAIANFSRYKSICNDLRNFEFMFDSPDKPYHFETKMDAVYRYLKYKGTKYDKKIF